MIPLFKRRTRKYDASITAVNPPWESCLAVCMKCARKVKAMDGDKTQLRVGLKALVTLRGLKKKIRPVDISCLDVCPEEKIVVALMAPREVRCKIVGPDATPEQILREFGF